ncbi:hypothetical protein FS837_009067 [Tulasnella sp. UAMH 9824]|nr:hypothetical protein FS837_009067 [Tulasnella sp. UAMH 9824]
MQSFVSKILAPFNDIRRRTPIVDEDAERAAPAGQSEGNEPINPSMRQRLDSLSSVRILPAAIKFTSAGTHKIGGKADVVRAIYRRRNENGEEVVAVKKLRYHRGMKGKKFGNEFVHEVEMMAGLSHENIVQLIGFVEDLENKIAWIVLSWAPNGNIREFLANGDWELPQRVQLIKNTFEGIKYLHTREPPICHGDLKSFNILVTPDYHAVITDFGSARAISESQDELTGTESGQQVQGGPTTEQASSPINVGAAGNQLTLTGPAWSLRWAAPEVMKGNRPGMPSDIWAAGWVCWEVMTDSVPFPELNSEGGITLTVIRGKVPSPVEEAQLGQIVALCTLMTDCWAFDPKARPNSDLCCNKLQWMPATPSPLPERSGSKGTLLMVLLGKGEILFNQGKYEEARLLFDQALSLARALSNQLGIAFTLWWLGRLHYAESKFAPAAESFTLAKKIWDSIGYDEGRAKALLGLGWVYGAQSKYTQAEESTTQAHAIYTRIGNDHGQANTLLELGQVHYLQSEYIQAEEFYTRAQEIYSRLAEDKGQASTLQGLGEVYRLQSKYDLAEKSFITAQEIYTRIGDDSSRADVIDGLARVYCLQSKLAQAEELYTRAEEIHVRLGDDLGRANALEGLGEIYRIQSKYAQAEESYTQAEKIYARLGQELGRANALYRLGAVYRLQCKYTQAEDSYTLAQEIYTRIGCNHNRAHALCDMGHMRRTQGRNAEAAAHYADAMDLYSRVGANSDVDKVSRWLAAVAPDHT